GTSHGPGYFAKVSTVTPSALTAGQFVAKFTERYEVAPDGTLESNLGPGNRYLYADKPWYAVTSAVQSPELPGPEPESESKAPEYPGSAKPTPAQIAAWGSDLTKDGYIPSVGMHVTGKGPMSGMIVSVNPTTSMAKVKTSDGKMSSRKVSALSVDVGANYTSYAPKAPVKDVPAGMPLAVTPPGEAIAATFATGKHHAILSDAQGVRSGAISMMRVKTPAGKSVVRVNLTLTKQQSQALIAKLKGDPNAPQPKVEPIGGWKKLSNKQSGDVAVGMKFAMKKTSSQGWLSDKNQDKPSYTVTAVDWDADGTGIVKMKHDNGDEITADFKTGFPMITYEWDPTVMPPPPPATPGHSNFTLSEQAKAMKWTHVTNEGVISAVKGGDATGNGVLDITPGQKVPTGNSAVEFLGSTDGLRKVSADGVVIEVMRPNHTATPNSWNGVTAITLPEGADEKMLAGAMADLGIDYAPMTQATAKKHARALMKSSFRFNKHDVDTPGTLTDADLFKLAADTFGVPDIGWQDIHMGVDDTIGKTTFFWSQRVRTAIAAKSKHSLVIRNGQTFQDNAAGIASNLLFGGVGGVQKRLTGMVYRTSGNMASHDAGNMANEGTFSSITTKHGDTLPQKNPHWGDWGFTVYHRPEAVLGRIGDIRAGYGDAFGNAGQDTNSVERALNTKEHQDYYIGGGTPPGSIAYIGVKSNKRRQEVIDYLAARGVTHIEGRPVADILILTSESHKYKVADLPPAKEPASSRPIEDLPMSYEQVPVESGEVEPPVTAAVDTEEAA
ncbi:MAG TPA: hypothetical protein VIU11_13040, partial [Nakamurella sp.]